jgi:hypothetical protein
MPSGRQRAGLADTVFVYVFVIVAEVGRRFFARTGEAAGITTVVSKLR